MNSGWFFLSLPLITWVVEILTTAGDREADKSAKLSGAPRAWPDTGSSSSPIVAVVAAIVDAAGKGLVQLLGINVPITQILHYAYEAGMSNPHPVY